MTPGLLLPAVLAALSVAVLLAPARGARAARTAASLVPPTEGAGARMAPVGLVGGSGPGAPAGGAAPGTLVTNAAALGVGAGVALLVGSAAGLVLGAVAVPLARRWLSRLEPAAARRRREELERGVPLIVDLLAACLRAGQAPGGALAAVAASSGPGPLRDELSLVVARLRLGGDPLVVWRALGAHPQLGAVGRSVARALDGGACVAGAMGDLAMDLRRARRAEVQARARAVGARAAAPLGLCLLPAFVLVGIVPVVAGSLGVLLGP